MKKEVSLILFLILLAPVYAAEEHLLPLQGIVKLNSVNLASGDVIVEIYDAPSSGNLVYNSSTDFLGTIRSGKYDILLGNGTQPLSLKFGTKYYMDMYVSGTDLDFNGSERQVFMSTVGNISLTTPISTSSTDTDDALNVSSGGTYLNGKTVIGNNDGDDALNLSNGGAFIAGEISTNSAFRTVNSIYGTGTNTVLHFAGKVNITNNDADDALNVSTGGSYLGGKVKVGSTDADDALNVSGGATFVNIAVTGNLVDALNASVGGIYVGGNSVFNKFFNITTTASAVRTNGTITILSTDADDALNVSTGGAYINGKTVIGNNDGDDALNLSNGGAFIAGEISTNSAFRTVSSIYGTGTNTVLHFAGKVNITNNDADDALNVSTGGSYLGGKVVVGSTDQDDALNVSGGATFVNIAVTGNIVDALNASVGGIYVGGNSVFNKFFNITTTASTVRTNGTITILSTDADDALNITSGGMFVAGDTVFNRFFNITTTASAVRTNGTITILSTDADDALNVTGGGAFNNIIANGNLADALNITVGGAVIRGSAVQVGFNESAAQNHLDIYDGGTNKCSYLTLYNETGNPNYLFVTNQTLRISDAIPAVCDNTEGHAVGNATYGGV